MVETDFIDAEGQTRPQQTSSFREIVLRHIERITRLSSVEMRGGFTMQVPSGTGSIRELYVPDTRESYINAVYNLADLLFAHFDKKTIEIEQELENKVETKLQYIRKKIKEDDDKEDYYANIFRNYKYEQLRILFRYICVFLKKHNYLELGTYTDR